jgi:hypothetical protein
MSSHEQRREESEHVGFLERFDGRFQTRARRELHGEESYEWPHVEARPFRHPPDTAALAEFAAGVLIAPSPQSGREPWRVRGILYRDPKGPPIVGDLVVEHFPISKKGARGEVTGTVLRALPLGKIRREASEHALTGVLRARIARGMSEEQLAPARRAVAEAGKPRPGRPGYPDKHYQQIAERYLDLIEAGRRNVLVALAAEESARQGREIPRETIRDWVRKATERGYLAPGKPGRAEARPGPKLKRKGK